MSALLLPAIVALFASLLTFFSGFGLGTLLTPVLLLFYPVDVAIALTATVHFLNNVFKFALMAKHTNFRVLLKFGIPAFAGAGIGAYSLQSLAGLNNTLQFTISTISFETELLKVVVGVLILFFALFELLPKLKDIHFGEQSLLPGGFFSGFFGGLSGHQGALRSAFLVRALQEKQAFVATGIAIALIVDLTRIPIYFSGEKNPFTQEELPVLTVTVLAALIGAVAGRMLLQKTTLEFLQQIVGWLLVFVSLALISGFI
jgi:uncharacterized membrane protein YfcA